MLSRTHSDFRSSFAHASSQGSGAETTREVEVDPLTATQLLSSKEDSFKRSVMQNTFRSTFTKLSKQKKDDMPDIYALRKDTPVDIFKPKDGQYQNLQFKPKMNLNKLDLYQPQALQFVLRPRKVHVGEKKQEEQIIAGKKSSLMLFEQKQHPKPLKHAYKFQVNTMNWSEQNRPPRSIINPMLLVPNPQDKKDDLEIKKVPLLIKTAGTGIAQIATGDTQQNNPHQGTQLNPLKNEFIENQLIPSDQSNNNNNNNNNNNTNSTEDYQEDQQRRNFQTNEALKREFADFMQWQQHRSDFDLHPDFFQPEATFSSANQDNIMQIGKCLILTHQNSPQTLKDRRTVTLGRPGVDFLRVTRFRDAIYFEDKVTSDKKPPHWNEMQIRDLQQQMQSTLRGSQSLKNNRLSKGLVSEYKPELKCVYPLRIAMTKHSTLDVSLKKMNRNKTKYLQEIKKKYKSSQGQSNSQQNDQDSRGEQLGKMDNQSELGFEDLQNGIYVTAAFPQ